MRFNYFYTKFDWQTLKTLSALVDCFNVIPEAWYGNYIYELYNDFLN